MNSITLHWPGRKNLLERGIWGSSGVGAVGMERMKIHAEAATVSGPMRERDGLG